MPKVICVDCQVEYRPEKNGVIVEEMASFGSYKLWNADLWKCPKCGHLIISGFADRNFAEHYQDDYKEQLEKTKDDRYPFFEFSKKLNPDDFPL